MRQKKKQLRSTTRARRSHPPKSDRFERLLGDLSAAFARARPHAIDSEIARWLKRIVLTLDLDRAGVLQIDPLTHRVYNSHQWMRPGVPRTPPHEDLRQLYPAYARKLLAGKAIVYSDLAEVPRELAQDALRNPADVPRSHVAIPVRVGGTVAGAVGFATFRRTRIWNARLLDRLYLIAGIFGNALERKRAAMKDARLREELLDSSRAAVMGELAASVAHELNQPIAAILSNAEAILSLLEAEPPDLAEIRTAINEIIQDDTRASETIRHLRSLFRHDRTERVALDVGEVVRDVSRIVQTAAIANNVSLALDIARPVPAIRGDRVQLQEAVLNLVRNAFDAVRDVKDGPREVVLRVGKKPGSVVIRVSDSGAGIDPSVAPRIFAPFFTTKPSGMGMGLAVSRAVVEAHGGRLSLAPDSFSGATFLLELPVRSTDDA